MTVSINLFLQFSPGLQWNFNSTQYCVYPSSCTMTQTVWGHPIRELGLSEWTNVWDTIQNKDRYKYWISILIKYSSCPMTLTHTVSLNNMMMGTKHPIRELAWSELANVRAGILNEHIMLIIKPCQILKTIKFIKAEASILQNYWFKV